VSSQALAALRSRWRAEIESDPQLKRAVIGMLATEGEKDPVPVMESLYNRAAYTGQPIKSLLLSGFYGPINRGELPGMLDRLDKDPERRARLEQAYETALSSNTIKGATDQGLPTDPNGQHQGGRIVRGGNVFNDWGGGPGGHEGAAAFRASLQRIASDDTGDASMLSPKLLGYKSTSPFPTVDPNNPQAVIPSATATPGTGATPAMPYMAPGLTLNSTPGWQNTAGTMGGTDTSALPTPDQAAAPSGGIGDYLKGISQNKDLMAGLGDISKGLSGAKPQLDTSITPISSGLSTGNQQMAANMLTQMLAAKRRPYGMTLTG